MVTASSGRILPLTLSVLPLDLPLPQPPLTWHFQSLEAKAAEMKPLSLGDHHPATKNKINKGAVGRQGNKRGVFAASAAAANRWREKPQVRGAKQAAAKQRQIFCRPAPMARAPFKRHRADPVRVRVTESEARP